MPCKQVGEYAVLNNKEPQAAILERDKVLGILGCMKSQPINTVQSNRIKMAGQAHVHNQRVKLSNRSTARLELYKDTAAIQVDADCADGSFKGSAR